MPCKGNFNERGGEMKFKEFIKPTVWKIIFTAVMILFGAIVIGVLLQSMHIIGGYFFRNYLFGHFYYSARILVACNMAGQTNCGGPTFDYFTSAIILIVQIIFYYLIACLTGLLFRRNKK
jgi:hypothetical protein